MSSIINERSLQRIENFKKYVLRAAVWVLVGAVAIGALAILMAGTDSGEIIGKFVGTLFIIALMMMVSVNNFKRIASREPSVQIFALLGLFFNMVWAILWTLICWNPSWATVCTGCDTRTKYQFLDYCYQTCVPSILIRSAAVASYMSALGFIGSNVMSLYEGNKRGIIRPLKITAVVCATYEMLYFTMISIGSEMNYIYNDRFGMLAGFVGFAWFAIVIAAWIISRSERNKMNRVAVSNNVAPAPVAQAPVKENKAPKTDDELRAEIEEQVRREMIEKEVRARFEKEKEKQSDNKDE